ncbi:MAG: sigma-54-dependent Fis family transcriptional regulator [Rhizobiaceae bacterium]|nr:sigma-54-dependent Fis family transcriptional regulator [Rhizobiaceae bacterium]
MTQTILIVDDDPVQRRILENSVNKMGYRAVTCEDGESALARLRETSSTPVDLVVLDLVMPGIDGMGVLSALSEDQSAVPVIVQTSKGGIETVVSAVRAGAVDFCVKPVSMERLKVSIQNALKVGAMEQVVQKIRKSSQGTFTFDDMVGSSPAMERAKKLGQRAADSNIPILLEGESGVGKEVFAKAVQGASERSGKPFITVNCGALPENLAESILFGHEKGAFTGATQNHTGKFKEADGGTLFLDEVGELSLDLQVKLLRAIQEGEIDPVGAKRPVKTDFRLISATNRDMIERVQEGHFREDLYYRLNVFPINVPPLRARKADIAALIQHFTARICLEEGRRNISGISHDALAMLEAYDWPGNIRQLENTIFRAVILCDGQQLTIDEFPQVASALGKDFAPDVTSATVVPMSAAAPSPLSSHDEDAADDHMIEAMKAEAERGVLQALSSAGDVRSLEDVEGDLIRFAIEHHGGRMTRVARSLDIGRSTLYRKLKELGIDAGEPRQTAKQAANG